MSVWLTFWSVGVAAIQISIFFEGGLPWLFVFSHGGSEVLVLWHVTRKLRNTAISPVLLDGDSTLEGQTLRWRLGTARPFTATLAMGLAIVIYLILLTPLVLHFLAPKEFLPTFGEDVQALSAAPSALIALGFAAVWLYTMTWWVKAFKALKLGLTTVSLQATAHQLTLTEDRPGPDKPPMQFETGQVIMTVETPTKDPVLVLTDGVQQWQRPFPMGAVRMLAPIQQIIKLAQPDGPVAPTIPRPLSTLRSDAKD
jgi:hypothetical protein